MAEPVTTAAVVSAGLSIYQAGGFALLLLAVVVIGGTLMGRFLMAMIRDLGARLNSVQDNQTDLLVGVVKDCTASNHALREEMREQTSVIRQQNDVLRARPCLIETGTHQRPALPHH